jgi:hypothetical protein
VRLRRAVAELDERVDDRLRVHDFEALYVTDSEARELANELIAVAA